MDTKINYTLIGLFVFGLGLCLILFLLWMGKYGFEETAYDHYTIKMPDGVAGLNIESPVKYRGMEVGLVDKIKIDSDNSEFINVSISVALDTPIKEDTIAVLTAQGITGLSYIELKGGTQTAKKLPSGATISAGQSLFDKLESSATDISTKLVQTMTRVDQLISNKNIQSIEKLLSNLEQSSHHLAEQMQLFLNTKNAQAMAETLNNTAQFTQTLADNRHSIEQLLKQGIQAEKQAVETLHDISSASLSLDKTLATLQTKFDSGEYDIRQMTEPHLEAFNDLLKEIQSLSIQANDVLQQLKESPSDLFFKQQQYQRGPGER